MCKRERFTKAGVRFKKAVVPLGYVKLTGRTKKCGWALQPCKGTGSDAAVLVLLPIINSGTYPAHNVYG